VVLTGEGGDEMFAGYLRYAHWQKLDWQERLGRLLPRAALPETWPFLGIRRLAGGDAAVFAGVYADPRPVQNLFPALASASGARDVASRRFRRFPERLFAVDQTAYLESLLMRQDKVAMAASVEARTPFVHLPLARVLNRLPSKIRAPGGVTKPLLKKIAESYLPHNLLYRRKIGLHLPVAEWLSDTQGVGRYLDALTEPNARLASFTDGRRLRSFVDLFRGGGRPDLVPGVMRLVNLEIWLRSLPSAPT
jgi:asparagine synthase (glutamine-hydrolysing)